MHALIGYWVGIKKFFLGSKTTEKMGKIQLYFQ